MREKILVIGATGNVGRNLVSELVERGVTVRAATRRPDEYERPAGRVEVIARKRRRLDIGGEE